MSEARFYPIRSIGASFLIGVILFLGCSQPDGPELGTVSGRVLIDGKPLPYAMVVFSLGQGRSSSGITDSEGRYELRYTVDRKGALLGKHNVQVYVTSETDNENAERVPYPHKDSELVYEVKSGNNVFNIDLS